MGVGVRHCYKHIAPLGLCWFISALVHWFIGLMESIHYAATCHNLYKDYETRRMPTTLIHLLHRLGFGLGKMPNLRISGFAFN